MAKPVSGALNTGNVWASRFRNVYLLLDGSDGASDADNAQTLNLTLTKGTAPTWATGLDGMALRCVSGAYYNDTTGTSLLGTSTDYPLCYAITFSFSSAPAGTQVIGGTFDQNSTSNAIEASFQLNSSRVVIGAMRYTTSGTFNNVSTFTVPTATVITMLYVGRAANDHSWYCSNNLGTKVTAANNITKGDTNTGKRFMLGGRAWAGGSFTNAFAGDIYFAAVGYGGGTIADSECYDFVANPWQICTGASTTRMRDSQTAFEVLRTNLAPAERLSQIVWEVARPGVVVTPARRPVITIST